MGEFDLREFPPESLLEPRFVDGDICPRLALHVLRTPTMWTVYNSGQYSLSGFGVFAAPGGRPSSSGTYAIMRHIMAFLVRYHLSAHFRERRSTKRRRPHLCLAIARRHGSPLL